MPFALLAPFASASARSSKPVVHRAVQFLAVILVPLLGDLYALPEHTAEGMVVVHLQYRPVLVDHYPVVTLMVLQVVIVRGHCYREGGIPFPREDHAQRAVLYTRYRHSPSS